MKLIDDYNENVVNWTYTTANVEVNALPAEMKQRNPDLYYSRANTLARQEQALVGAYDELVRLARRKLGVDIPRAD